MNFIKAFTLVTLSSLNIITVAAYADRNCDNSSLCSTLNGTYCAIAPMSITNTCKKTIYLSTFEEHHLMNQSLYVNGKYESGDPDTNMPLGAGQTGQLVGCINQDRFQWDYSPPIGDGESKWDMSVSDVASANSSLGQVLLHYAAPGNIDPSTSLYYTVWNSPETGGSTTNKGFVTYHGQYYVTCTS